MSTYLGVRRVSQPTVLDLRGWPEWLKPNGEQARILRVYVESGLFLQQIPSLVLPYPVSHSIAVLCETSFCCQRWCFDVPTLPRNSQLEWVGFFVFCICLRVVFCLYFPYIFLYFGKAQEKEYNFTLYISKYFFRLELQTGKARRQNLFDSQRNVVRLPDNHERLLQETVEPASHPTHINAYEVAIPLNLLAASHCFKGRIFERTKGKSVFLKYRWLCIFKT